MDKSIKEADTDKAVKGITNVVSEEFGMEADRAEQFAKSSIGILKGLMPDTGFLQDLIKNPKEGFLGMMQNHLGPYMEIIKGALGEEGMAALNNGVKQFRDADISPGQTTSAPSAAIEAAGHTKGKAEAADVANTR